jgi:hypothetical protein
MIQKCIRLRNNGKVFMCVCGGGGGVNNERSRPPIDRVPATFIVDKLKIILDLTKYVQQTVCRSWAEFVYPNESMLGARLCF